MKKNPKTNIRKKQEFDKNYLPKNKNKLHENFTKCKK